MYFRPTEPDSLSDITTLLAHGSASVLKELTSEAPDDIIHFDFNITTHALTKTNAQETVIFDYRSWLNENSDHTAFPLDQIIVRSIKWTKGQLQTHRDTRMWRLPAWRAGRHRRTRLRLVPGWWRCSWGWWDWVQWERWAGSASDPLSRSAHTHTDHHVLYVSM